MADLTRAAPTAPCTQSGEDDLGYHVGGAVGVKQLMQYFQVNLWLQVS